MHPTSGTDLRVTNVHSGDVGFKIMTTRPARYVVSRKVGMIAPGDTVSIKITMRDSEKDRETQSDKFLFLAAAVPSEQLSESMKKMPEKIWEIPGIRDAAQSVELPCRFYASPADLPPFLTIKHSESVMLIKRATRNPSPPSSSSFVPSQGDQASLPGEGAANTLTIQRDEDLAASLHSAMEDPDTHVMATINIFNIENTLSDYKAELVALQRELKDYKSQVSQFTDEFQAWLQEKNETADVAGLDKAMEEISLLKTRINDRFQQADEVEKSAMSVQLRDLATSQQKLAASQEDMDKALQSMEKVGMSPFIALIVAGIAILISLWRLL